MNLLNCFHVRDYGFGWQYVDLHVPKKFGEKLYFVFDRMGLAFVLEVRVGSLRRKLRFDFLRRFEAESKPVKLKITRTWEVEEGR